MSSGISIKGYHADNGCYSEPTFKEDCHSKLQNLTFCGVGARHQNGISEVKIKQLTLATRTLLVHAQRYWPEDTSTMLWPLALLATAERINNLHIDLNGSTPEMKFSKVAGSSTRIKNYHNFGCPCYILDARLQDAGGAGPPKLGPTLQIRNIFGAFPKPCW